MITILIVQVVFGAILGWLFEDWDFSKATGVSDGVRWKILLAGSTLTLLYSLLLGWTLSSPRVSDLGALLSLVLFAAVGALTFFGRRKRR